MSDATQSWSGTNRSRSLQKEIHDAAEQMKILSTTLRRTGSVLEHQIKSIEGMFGHRDAWVIGDCPVMVEVSWSYAGRLATKAWQKVEEDGE
jgi:hypothetical protein